VTETPPPPLTYRLLTGNPDRAFCERVSEALDTGCALYGQPILTATDDGIVAAQAVVLTDRNPS
jgi:hypothetical protein